MFRKKFFWLVIIILLILASAGSEVIAMAQANSPTTEQDHPIQELTPEHLETFLDEYLSEQMEPAHVPGLVITVVQGDQVLLAKGYGYADIESKLPMTPQTNIRAGSVSKSILATFLAFV